MTTITLAAGNNHSVQSAARNKVNLRIHDGEADADGTLADNLRRELARQFQPGFEGGFARPSFKLLRSNGYQTLRRGDRRFSNADAGQSFLDASRSFLLQEQHRRQNVLAHPCCGT